MFFIKILEIFGCNDSNRQRNSILVFLPAQDTETNNKYTYYYYI
jgi:hypothetical protein